jgi:arylsulfatase A-like enzyme
MGLASAPAIAETVSPVTLSPRAALFLAAWSGIVGGYIDLGMIFVHRHLFHASLYYEQGNQFRWTVPAANLALLIVPGLLVAGLNRLRPGLLSLPAAARVFATLALWGAFLRAPFYGAATLVLALGMASVFSRWIKCHVVAFMRLVRYSLVVLLPLLGGTAAISYGRQLLAESRALAQLPAPPVGAFNVLLIVMDTVRAENLGLCGYARETTPELARWAKRGVHFERAVSPAPWTFPAHCSFMTGQWPSTLGAHWRPILDSSYPTLAGFLASRGYLTAGFVANTFWCSYESGMDRGFVHYEDYPLNLRTIMGSTILGRWLLENLRRSRDFYAVKWIRAQSRDGEQINRDFLDWLSAKPPARPFFAFLNYLDAHEPFLPPIGEGKRFGEGPQTPAEYQMLLRYWDLNKLQLSEHEVKLARDSYDNCIAALDRRIGSLLDELDRRGTLQDTLVIITSDHGEEFGEHGAFNHGYSVYAQEIHVPLLIISRSAPPGRTIAEPIGLRDLPATIVDILGLREGSPFPGSSLVESWRPRPAERAPRVPWALSEVHIPLTFGPERGHGPRQRGVTMSLVAEGLHYLLDMYGIEELYDLTGDRHELRDLRNDPARQPALGRLRLLLAQILHDNQPTSPPAAGYHKALQIKLDSLIPPPLLK